MNDLKTIEGGTVAIPADILAALAAEAKDAAAKERPAISRISLKSGVMSYQGAAIAGNKMEVVILGASYRNVFYSGRYDPNNIVSPTCFALAEEDDGMAPHENVSAPPAESCAKCPNNEWGSDPNGGRGKACKQTRRLVLMPGTAVAGGAEMVKTAELAIMDLPVTSVKNYSNYVNTLAAATSMPPWAAIAEVSVTPDAKTQFKVNFRAMRVLPDASILEAMRSRKDMALRIAMEPYEETNVPVDENDRVKDPGKSVSGAPKKQKF